MKISAESSVHELLEKFPFLEEFLGNYHPAFKMLQNPVARATIARVATLGKAAMMTGVDLEALLEAIAVEIARVTGHRPVVLGASKLPPELRQQRIGVLKEIIQDLHDGGDLDAARARFASSMSDVEATEIASMEEELIREGLPVEEVQRLCDVHVSAFREALDTHAAVEVPPGHPIHTYQADNARLTTLATALGEVASAAHHGDGVDFERASEILDALAGVENHYQRKENQLFPYLEKHGVTGPSQVMWGVHDEIRASLKRVVAMVEARDGAGFVEAAPALGRDIVEMVYKEEKVLFPLTMDKFDAAEWRAVREGEDELGYVLSQPAADFPADGAVDHGGAVDDGGDAGGVSGDLLKVTTGELTLEQINLIFSHLPVDLSFVDEKDEVRFYSEGPDRIFPRTPGVIGRQVKFCHPPKSVHIVEEILDSFREGKHSTAEFWLELMGRFIHIRYFAVRDAAGAYRGCLEVSQDITGIRALEGERRLLEWSGK